MFNPFKEVAKVVTPHLAKKKEEVAELGEELRKVVESVETSVQAQKEKLQAIIEESKALQAKLQDASGKYKKSKKSYGKSINQLEAVEIELDQDSLSLDKRAELQAHKAQLEAAIKIHDKAMLKHAKEGADRGKELKQLDSEIDALSAAIDEAEKHLATKDEEELEKIKRRLDNLGEDGALFSDIIGIANNVGSLYAAAHGEKQEGTSGEIVDTVGNALEGNVGGALKSARGLIVSGVSKAIEEGHVLMREFEDVEAQAIDAKRRWHYQRHSKTGAAYSFINGVANKLTTSPLHDLHHHFKAHTYQSSWIDPNQFLKHAPDDKDTKLDQESYLQLEFLRDNGAFVEKALAEPDRKSSELTKSWEHVTDDFLVQVCEDLVKDFESLAHHYDDPKLQKLRDLTERATLSMDDIKQRLQATDNKRERIKLHKEFMMNFLVYVDTLKSEGLYTTAREHGVLLHLQKHVMAIDRVDEDQQLELDAIARNNLAAHEADEELLKNLHDPEWLKGHKFEQGSDDVKEAISVLKLRIDNARRLVGIDGSTDHMHRHDLLESNFGSAFCHHGEILKYQEKAEIMLAKPMMAVDHLYEKLRDSKDLTATALGQELLSEILSEMPLKVNGQSLNQKQQDKLEKHTERLSDFVRKVNANQTLSEKDKKKLIIQAVDATVVRLEANGLYDQAEWLSVFSHRHHSLLGLGREDASEVMSDHLRNQTRSYFRNTTGLGRKFHEQFLPRHSDAPAHEFDAAKMMSKMKKVESGEVKVDSVASFNSDVFKHEWSNALDIIKEAQHEFMGHHYVLEDPLHVGAYQLDQLVRGDVARAVVGESQPNKTQEEAFDKAIKEQLPSLLKLLRASRTYRHQRVMKILKEKCPTGVTAKEEIEFAEEKKNKLERARTDDLELEKSLEQLVYALEHYQKDKSPERRENLMKAQKDFARLRGRASGLYAKVGESMAYMEKLQDAVDFVVEAEKKMPSSKAYYPEVKLAAKHVFSLHNTSLPSYYTSDQVSASSDERAMDHRSGECPPKCVNAFNHVSCNPSLGQDIN